MANGLFERNGSKVRLFEKSVTFEEVGEVHRSIEVDSLDLMPEISEFVADSRKKYIINQIEISALLALELLANGDLTEEQLEDSPEESCQLRIQDFIINSESYTLRIVNRNDYIVNAFSYDSGCINSVDLSEQREFKLQESIEERVLAPSSGFKICRNKVIFNNNIVTDNDNSLLTNPIYIPVSIIEKNELLSKFLEGIQAYISKFPNSELKFKNIHMSLRMFSVLVFTGQISNPGAINFKARSTGCSIVGVLEDVLMSDLSIEVDKVTVFANILEEEIYFFGENNKLFI